MIYKSLLQTQGFIRSASLARAQCSTLNKVIQTKQPIHRGYSYDQIDTSQTYKIRSLLNEAFDEPVEEGFHLAYNNFVQAMAEKDLSYLSEICHPKLCLAIQNTPQIKLFSTGNSYRDLIYTDISLILGERSNLNPVRLQFMDILNIDIYPLQDRMKIENFILQLECYILQDHTLLTPAKDESLYHRVVFETEITHEQRSMDFVQLALLSKKRRKKMLRNILLGREFDWFITEIDSHQA